jgi:hypothetical protein
MTFLASFELIATPKRPARIDKKFVVIFYTFYA